MGRAPLELAGMRFGRLVAIERLHALPDVGFQWRCACDCGNECIYPAKMLKLQAIQSCGCGMRAARRETRPGAHRNGATQTGEYHAWQSMLRRCDPRNAVAFPDYAGRGITVCEAWEASFEAFARDMGPRPTDQHSLDRINNDGNYEPSNCRWATSKQQRRNNRHNRFVVYRGERMALADACELAGIDRRVAYKHIYRKGSYAGLQFVD